LTLGFAAFGAWPLFIVVDIWHWKTAGLSFLFAAGSVEGLPQKMSREAARLDWRNRMAGFPPCRLPCYGQRYHDLIFPRFIAFSKCLMGVSAEHREARGTAT